VGASFAGLAAAGELAGAGRVLVLDRAPVGEGETSACATPLRVLERYLDAVTAFADLDADPHREARAQASRARARERASAPLAPSRRGWRLLR
jgi:flavin-dependent dehydrogenase